MKILTMVLVAGVLAVAGCGEDDETPASGSQQNTEAAMEKKAADDAAMEKKAAGDAMAKADGTKIVAGESQFGEMLFDSKKQAIYIFENDPKGETVCYGECAEAWPPVLTDGEPAGGPGVEGSLLGTVERRDGKLQVTYAGKPLYYYAHEAPGEVKCHNVNLNGGFWWVVGTDGERLS